MDGLHGTGNVLLETSVAQGNGLRLPVGILGSGVSVPDVVVTNGDLERTLDTSDAWIVARTGIRERRFVGSGQATSDMCVDAARDALEESGTAPGELDAIVLATITPDQPLPSTALMVKEALGADNALALDLNQAACAGGVLGILLGAHLLQNTQFHRILVIGAESLSRLTDPSDRTTRVFFGDAAGAVVLGRTDDGYGLLSWDFGSLLSYAVEVPAGGSARPTTAETAANGDHFLKMDGQVVWEQATQRLPSSIRAAVEGAGLAVSDIQHFFLHQANRNIIESVVSELGVPTERAGVTIDMLGNTGAATIFTVLHQAIRRGELRRGDLAVISGIGAGFLWGSLCLRHQ